MKRIPWCIGLATALSTAPIGLAATRCLAANAESTVPRGPGSILEPIPIAGTEITARAPGRAGPRDASEIDIGSVRARFYGIRGVGPVRESAADGSWDASRGMESNVYWGGGMEVGIERFPSVHLECGRVVLRDPTDVRTRDGRSSEYWAASAGLAVRF